MATIPSDTTMWIATQIGARCVRTLMPPITACRTTPKNSSHDSLISSGRRGRHRRQAMIAAPTQTVTANVSMRLLNSTAPLIPSFAVGTRLSAVHVGHVGQPSPLRVRRTAPPVTMMPMFAASAAKQAQRSTA